jgi:cytochrome c-type biogenesis protein
MLSALFALAAGIVTVAAPCTLPVLPILLGASIAGRDQAASKTRPLFIAFGFIVAFAAVTLVFSFFARAAGLSPDQLRNVAIALLAAFGVLMVWPSLYARISATASSVFSRFSNVAPRTSEGAVGGLLIGATLGLVWTPCAGPVLGSILTLLATQKQPEWAATLLTLYAIGAAIPMFAIAYGGQVAATRVRAIAPYAQRLQQGFGVLIVSFAAAMYFQVDTQVTAWLTQFYPAGQIGL